MILGALEAGGTKMICSIGDETGRVFERESFPTTTPDETMPKLIDYFRGKSIEAIGVGGFGPLDLDPLSPTYGYVTTTPKLEWQFYPIMPVLRDALKVPAGVDTDVNVAGLAEFELGAGKGKKSCFYLTVGTGIGAGVVAENHLLHGLVHPEWGHILLRPHPADPLPRGVCPFHEGCLEGLASGPSFDARWGQSSKDLPEDHIGWTIEAHYLAQLCMTAILALSPEHIVLGGGVMQRGHLLPLIRKETQRLLNGYIAHDAILHNIDGYITSPGLGQNSGVAGALLLAAQAADRERYM